MQRRGEAPGAAGRTTLSCVDDACLLNVFRFLSPLPDLFAAAAVCKRWHKVAADSRLRLVVAAGGAPADAPAAPWGAPGWGRHASLAAAVAASAPGQSIFLEPGEHALEDVRIRWPLALSGAAGSVLLVPAGAARGLAVHAACRLSSLDVRSAQLAACVEHVVGRLRIERCALRCADAGEHPLAHLSAPILSRARGAPAEAHTLTVAESRCEGGAAAVRCEGGGRLEHVRVIYGPRRAVLWFDVVPSRPDDAAPDAAAAAPTCAPLLEPPPPPPLLEPPPAGAKLAVAA